LIVDEEIRMLIQEGYNNYEIARQYGRATGSMAGQIRRLREELGIPSPGRKGAPRKPSKRKRGQNGLISYQLSEAELQEVWRKYGKPGEYAGRSSKAEQAADRHLIEKAVAIKDRLHRHW